MNGTSNALDVIVCRWDANAEQPARLARLCLRPKLVSLRLDVDLVDDVLLAASELVANATEHATGPYELRLLSDGSHYVLECHDCSPELPPVALRPHGGSSLAGMTSSASLGWDRLGERGRGLSLLSGLFHGCLSARRTPSGKVVFVAFGAPAPG